MKVYNRAAVDPDIAQDIGTPGIEKLELIDLHLRVEMDALWKALLSLDSNAKTKEKEETPMNFFHYCR